MDTAPQTVTIVVPAEALIGLEKVQIHRNADVVSDIRSNGKVKVERGNGADDPGAIQGSIQTTGDVQILRDNVISGDVTAGGRVRLHRSVIVEGEIQVEADVEAVYLPPVRLDVITRGARKITVKKNEADDLPPNDETTPAYGDLRAKKGSTVTLHSGVYYFKKFDLAKETTLVFDLDGGPVTANIGERLSLG